MSAEMVKFRKALLDRGLALGELGRQLGVSEDTMYSLASNGFSQAISLRWKIERHLAYAYDLWTNRDVLEIRKGCAAVTGIDPFLAEKPVLLDLARRFEVRLTNVPRTVAGYRDAIVRHLAVNRSLITAPTP